RHDHINPENSSLMTPLLPFLATFLKSTSIDIYPPFRLSAQRAARIFKRRTDFPLTVVPAPALSGSALPERKARASFGSRAGKGGSSKASSRHSRRALTSCLSLSA